MQKLNTALIIGLGNPDLRYEKTYHNAGHLFVAYLPDAKMKLLKSEALKTDVAMNASGGFVHEAIKKYRVKPENLLLVHDDTDIPLGTFKFSFGRGSAGHRGVQNVIDRLRTNKFWRLRIGIRPAFVRLRRATVGKPAFVKATAGKPRRNLEKADDLVLKKITPARLILLQRVFKEATSAL